MRVLKLSLVFVVSCVWAFDESRADALTDLDRAFREAYSAAAARKLSELRTSVPVLVNRFGQIGLYRPGIDKPEIFSMDMKVFLQARSVAHTPVAIYSRLAPFGLGKLDTDRLEWLANYEKLVGAAEVEIAARRDVPTKLKDIQIEMLENIRRYVQRIHQQGMVDQPLLDEMASSVKAFVRSNLEFAAASQLEQFRARLESWKAEYHELDWDHAVVVIIGGHQARTKYLQSQFFDWLLHDEPREENRVVFAETLALPAALEKEEPTNALVLLSKVILDKSIASTIFGRSLALQSDVLGEAAEAIIRDWH